MAQKVKFKFDLGKKVEDTLSGFTGCIECQTRWLNGCIQYLIRPRVDVAKPNELPEAKWFDEGQLAAVEDIESVSVPTSRTGGPHDVPTRNNL